MVKSRVVILFNLILLFCLITSSVIYLKPIKAQYQGDITINVDGSVTPSSATITQSGNLFSLTSDINGSITVNKNNIVLDGNNHTLLGAGNTALYGVLSMSGISNVTVENLVLPTGPFEFGNGYLTTGVSLTNCTGIHIQNNTITDFNSIQVLNGVAFQAISISGGNSNVIIRNTLLRNLVSISLYETSDNQIIANSVIDANSKYNYGISLYNASNNTIYHNNFINITTWLGDVPVSNQWNDSYSTGGNYWSDYYTKYPNAIEINNSGINNIPYAINQNNTDYYPLTTQVNISLPVALTTSCPSVPEFPTLTIPIIILVLVVVATSILLCRRHPPARF